MCTTATYRIFISIHSLRMEGDRQKFQDIAPKIGISIHSLRMEGDFTHVHFIYGISHFNPLPPHGGRRLRTHGVHNKRKISIHSLHTEGDIYHVTVACTRRISIHSLHTEGDEHANVSVQPTSHFNPLPPHGGRHANTFAERSETLFQSTPSTRRETGFVRFLFHLVLYKKSRQGKRKVV